MAFGRVAQSLLNEIIELGHSKRSCIRERRCEGSYEGKILTMWWLCTDETWKQENSDCGP